MRKKDRGVFWRAVKPAEKNEIDLYQKRFSPSRYLAANFLGHCEITHK
jgi:hypothetical protein